MNYFNIRRVHLLIVGLILFCFGLNGQTKFTVEEAIDYALMSHSSMRVADINAADAEWTYKENLAIGLPNFTADARYNYSFIRPKQVIEDFISPLLVGALSQTSLAPELQGFGDGAPQTVEAAFVRRNQLTAGINMNVFIFNGNFFKGLGVAKLFIDLAKKQKTLTEQDIRTNVIGAFNNVIVTQKNQGTILNNISNVSKLLNETRALYDNGFAEALDVDRLELSKHQLENELSKLEKLKEVALNVLKFQMAYPLEQPIEIVEDLEKDVDVILLESVDLHDEVDLNLRPEYSLLQDAISLDKADLNRIKSGYWPSLYGSATLEQNIQRDGLFNGDEPGWLPNGALGIRATVPIWDGGNLRAKIQRKKIVIEKREIELSEFERGLRLQVFNAKSNLINAKSNLSTAKRALEISEKIYEKTQIKYTNGVGSSIELTQAESSLYQAQANYINAMYEILSAQTELEIATGKINEK